MVPTLGTDCVDDLIDLLQWFSVHELVEFLNVGFDLLVVHAGGVVIGLVQQFQDAFWVG